MRRIFCFHLSLISFLFCFAFHGFSQTHSVDTPPPQLSFQSVQREGKALTITFQINYHGVVECRLFQGDKLIYMDQRVFSDGVHRFRINADQIVEKLGSGTYRIEFKYKGKTYVQSVTL